MIIEGEYDEIDEADGELDLSESDSLPWLEADEEVEDEGGVDTAQVVAFLLLLLLILLLVVGAIWYFGGRANEGDLVADGSTIEAPEGPVKERPEDPGGRQFAGTDDVAPIVGEGGTSEGLLATDGSSGGSGADSAETTSTSGVGVQLAAYSSRARAEQGWNEIARRTDALSGLRYRIEQGEVDIGTVYRLQAVANDRAAADQLCAALKADGIDCQVKP